MRYAGRAREPDGERGQPLSATDRAQHSHKVDQYDRWYPQRLAEFSASNRAAAINRIGIYLSINRVPGSYIP